MTLPVVPVERLDFSFAPRPWSFAVERRGEIDRHFQRLQAVRPAVWNGRVLLLHDHAIDGTVFRGRYFETDYASFLAWRDWDFPDRAVTNCFAMGALRTADGAFLLGEMAPHTANAGKIYFPGGTPDPDDVVDGRVDLAGNLWREIEEETGLTPADLAATAGWHGVIGGARIALIKLLQAREDAETLRARILAHIKAQRQSELSDIRVVRRPADLGATVPAFVPAFLDHAWSRLRA